MFISCILFSESHAFFRFISSLWSLCFSMWSTSGVIFCSKTTQKTLNADDIIQKTLSLWQGDFFETRFFHWHSLNNCVLSLLLFQLIIFMLFISGSAGNKEDISESRPRNRKHQNPETKEKWLLWNHFVCLNTFSFVSGPISVI